MLFKFLYKVLNRHACFETLVRDANLTKTSKQATFFFYQNSHYVYALSILGFYLQCASLLKHLPNHLEFGLLHYTATGIYFLIWSLFYWLPIWLCTAAYSLRRIGRHSCVQPCHICTPQKLNINWSKSNIYDAIKINNCQWVYM